MPIFKRHMPPDADIQKQLHDGLAAAGQTLSAEDMPEFMLTYGEPLRAGCKGEIAFRSMHVSELWVEGALRGQGIGAALLRGAEALARERGCLRIHLETRSEGARRLYERLGYEVFGTLPNYDGEQAFYYLEKRIDG